jgi:two-component system C4-dicarboxylate transport response regulator DctD
VGSGKVKVAQYRVAIIDDDAAACLSMGQMLRLRAYATEVFFSAEAALAWPGLRQVDCIVSDVKMPGISGEELLGEVLRRGYEPPVVMITGHGDIAMAVRCLKAGAYDFIEKPFDDDVFLASIQRAVEKRALRRESAELRRRLEHDADPDERWGMAGRSRAFLDLLQAIEVSARSDAPVLIQGETGAGKELVARAIHLASSRAAGPFIPVNTGGLPEAMLESELFGHTKGAFTGASADRDGKLASAAGGTLLLDEIESMPLRAQVHLLRVLEDSLVTPLGSDKARKVDFRLLTTAKTDLRAEVRAGRMREDFYHRIAVLTVTVPTLRERTEDLPLLVVRFLREAAAKNGVPVPRVSEKLLAEMTRYAWPGNVRELKNTVERMVITAADGVVDAFVPAHLGEPSRLLSLPGSPGRLHEEMERVERAVVESALREHSGEISTTAFALGISRRALYERMKKYGFQKETYK